MKNFSGWILLICLLLVLQSVCMPAFAAELDQSAPQTEGEPVPTAPAAELGSVTVESGCRTIDAQIPLGGSERILETAQAAFIYERNTGTVVYSFNPDLQTYPGTLAKMLNLIVALENCANLDEEVTVSTRNFKTLPSGARNAKLKEGEILTMRDLLHCMIVDGANDAALTIAEHIAGSEDAYVKMMNDYARNAGCTNTTILNCHGLNKSGQLTTARDMAKILAAASHNSQFNEIMGAKGYVVPETNKTPNKDGKAARDYKSLNYLQDNRTVTKYYDRRVTGGITNYTEASGASIAFTAEDKGMSYIMVIMGSTRKFASNGYTATYYGNFEEAWDALAFGFDNYKICRLLHDGQSMNQFPVGNGENQVVGQTHTAMDALLPADAKLKNLILKYSVVNGGLNAPIAKDQTVATMQIWYRNSCIAETELYAMSQVRSIVDKNLQIQGIGRNDSNVSGILSFIGVVSLILIVPVTIYLIVNNMRRTIARNRRRRRRKGRRRSY